MADHKLWLEFDCETSGRTAIVEDLGDSVWVFLTAPDGSTIERDCWLFNKKSAAPEPDLERYRSQSIPPPAPASLIHGAGRRDVPAEEHWSARWSQNGDSVVIAVDGIDLGLASTGAESGMSRYLVEECGWGQPWDDALLRRLL